jgi:hypothetical protein
MMQKTLLSAVLAAGLLAPAAAYAQPSSTITVPDGNTGHVWVIRPIQVLAIAAGVVVGAVVVEALIDTEIGYLVGGVAGGYLADVWYNGGQFEIHMDTSSGT